MKRDLHGLARGEHDLLVVGAGIHGAAAAREAALRGLDVALIERDDFGAGTSWNSLKTVHGGVRYLQKLDLARVWASVGERRRLLRLAPHLVRPLAFVLPTRGRGLRGRPALAAAMGAYGLLSARASRGLLPERRLPRPRTVGREALARLAPGLDLADRSGAAVWWDAQMYSSERLVLGFVQAAAARGARVANHLEAVEWLEGRSRICGVVARDGCGGEEIEIRARHVLLCAGPAAWDLLGRARGAKPPHQALGRAGNVVLRRPLFGPAAVGLSATDAAEGQGEQVLFAAPWRERTLLGTLHLPLGDSGSAQLSGDEIARLLAAVNRLCPGAALVPEDVALVHAGLQPIAGWDPRSGQARHAPDAILLDHEAREGVPGLHTLVGVKFTEAAGAAARAVQSVCRRLGRGGAVPEDEPLPGGGFASEAALLRRLRERAPAGLDDAVLAHLAASHGSGGDAVLKRAAAEPALAAPVAPGSPVIGAQVVQAVREEMAQGLADVVLRRTELGARGDLDPVAARRCGELMAAELGWGPQELERQIAALPDAAAAGGPP